MKRLLLLLVLSVCAGCEFVDDSAPLGVEENRYGIPQGVQVLWSAEHPAMDLPMLARCRNYAGGSCVIASTISLLRWQGQDTLADEFRRRYSGGQSSVSLHAKLDAHGLRYATTTSGDVRLLEWAIRTRRGAGITYYPNHFVNLVDLTPTHAVLLDNNRVERYITIPREEFVARWRSYGGWATIPVVGPPAPPLPLN